MKPYLVKTPSLIKFIFRNWAWSFSKKEKIIYLTFDDGPTPEITKWTLAQLNKYNAKATFFCIGKNVKLYPEIFQEISENNHSIGNHTHNHLNGLNMTTDDYLSEVTIAEKAILKATKTKTNLFRPPYGKFKISQAKQIRKKGYKISMWDVLSADFDTSISKEKCLENVIKNTKNGSIIVFHDSVKASEKLKFVLPQLLEYYTIKGFIFNRIE